MVATHKKITPALAVDTSALQNNTPTAGSKFNRNTLQATKAPEGVCASLVSFWLGERRSGTLVNNIDQFPSSFTLSIAQSRYESDRGTRAELMDRFGVKMISSNDKKKKWYMWKKTQIKQAVNGAAGWPGYYYLRVTGDGGHALGIVSTGTIQFFDPNEGIMTFQSTEDLRNWVVPHIVHEYSDLLDEVGLYAVSN